MSIDERFRTIIREELEKQKDEIISKILCTIKGKTEDNKECIICYENEDFTNETIWCDNGQLCESGTYDKVFKAKNGKYFYSD